MEEMVMSHAAHAVASQAMNIGMTHYMELLATNQPWNLIIFMAIPVILAETLTATEFFVIFDRLYDGTLRQFNRIVGIALGFYFLGIVVYLMITVIPTIQWRGIIDITAVGFYLSGVIFLFGITLLELGVIAKNAEKEAKMKLHFLLLIGFLIVAHIAMIFGMLNPALF
jgi:cytochrome c biogenesis protein CcdA